jgi:hypothetical protein
VTQIAELMPQIAADLGFIGKTDRNDFQGYQYRGIDTALIKLQPVLTKHGVSMLPRVVDVRTEVRQSSKGSPVNWCFLTVEYTFTASDGSSMSCVVVGEAADSQDKSSGQAMSQAMKQAIFQSFCVPTGDPDPDLQAPFMGQDAPPRGERSPRPGRDQVRARNNRETPPPVKGDGPSDAQKKMAHAVSKTIGLDTSEDRHAFMAAVVGRRVGSIDELSGPQRGSEISQLLDALKAVEVGDARLEYGEDGPHPVYGASASVSDDERPFLSRTDEALEVGITGRGEVRSW